MSAWIWVIIGLFSGVILGIVGCVSIFYAAFCSYDRHEVRVSGKDAIRNKVEDWLMWYGLAFAILGAGIVGAVALNPWWGFAIGGSFIGARICVWRFEEHLGRL